MGPFHLTEVVKRSDKEVDLVSDPLESKNIVVLWKDA